MGKDQEFLDAARNGNITAFEKILNQKSKRGGPLASLRRGPGINVQDSVGYSALHYSALNGHTDIVRLLLFHDASPNLLDSRGSSPLHLAAWAGQQEIVKMLLTHPYKPANPDMRTMENETPLHCAAQHGHTGALTTLLAHGADPNVRNNRNETPLDLAAQYGRLQAVQMLIRAHPELLQPYSSESNSSTSVSSTNVLNHSALHLASRNGHNNVVDILLAAGVNVNLLTPSGTALHEAALCGKDLVVRTLLEAGADLNATDSEGRTPMDVLQEFPPHVTKSIIAVIDKFRNGENSELNNEGYDDLEKNDEASTYFMAQHFPVETSKQDNLRLHNHVFSISPSVSTHSLEKSNLFQEQNADGELVDFYVKMEPTKIQKEAPKKPPRRNLSISPIHLQNFFLNNELTKSDLEFFGNNAGEKTRPMSLEKSHQSQGSYERIDVENSDLRIHGNDEHHVYSNHTIPETKCATDLKPIPAPSYDNATLRSYNPNRKLKRNREDYFGKCRFSSTISSDKHHLLESLKKQNNSGPRRPLSQEFKCSRDNDHQNIYAEAGISPQDNHPLCLSLCNSSGSISSGVSLSDRSLSTDCVEEYVADEPFAGLYKGSTININNECCNVLKGHYVSNEYNQSSVVLRSRCSGREKHAASTTDSQSESSDEGPTTNNDIRIRKTKRDKRLSSESRSKIKESHIRKTRLNLSCENNSKLSNFSSSLKNDFGNIPTLASVNNKESVSTKKPHVPCRTSKILSSYNEQETWDKLSEIMETFGNSTLDGLNSFSDYDEINRSEENSKLAKLLHQNGLKHLESLLYANGYDNFRFLNGVFDDNDLSIINASEEDAHKMLNFIKTLPLAHFKSISIDSSLEQWLTSIQLTEYTDNFKNHLYNTLKSVCGVWEIELQTVLEINKIGHRKRILYSVAQIRQNVDIKKSHDGNAVSKENNPKGTLGHSKKNRPAPKPPIKNLEIRAPSELLIGLPSNLRIKWPHSASSLISKSLTYEVCYLGSTVVKELRGTETTRKSIQKLKRVGQTTNLNGSSEKRPIVHLSISFKGVEFIDVQKSEIICEHEIRNINCACQDADDMRHFAYITKDNGLNTHYCHVFNVDNMHLAMEIILTLAESFEVAYQMALSSTPSPILKAAEQIPG